MDKIHLHLRMIYLKFFSILRWKRFNFKAYSLFKILKFHEAKIINAVMHLDKLIKGKQGF